MPMSRLFAGHVGDVPAVDQHPAAVGPVEAGDRPQRRRLAAARRAEQGEELAAGDVEVEPVERDDRAVAAGQPVQPDGDARAVAQVGGAPAAAARSAAVMRSPSCRAGGPARRSAAAAPGDHQGEHRHRDRQLRLRCREICTIQVGKVSKPEDVAMVNSPSTSATVRNAALSTDVRSTGRTTRDQHPRPGGAEAAGGLGQRAQVDAAHARRPAPGRRTAAPGRT